MNRSRAISKSAWIAAVAAVLCLSQFPGCGSDSGTAPEGDSKAVMKGMTGQSEKSLETKKGREVFKSIKNRPGASN